MPALGSVLYRWYSPCGIRIDDVDLAVVYVSWLRRQVGVVLQEYVLFNRSIRDNIALSDPGMPIDRNGNGNIDNGGELFGNYTPMANGVIAANGFAALASYDSNADGKINASDPIWNNLQVWIDSNGNGVTDPGELHSLSSLGIQSLNLTYTNQGTGVHDAAGNNPQYVGTFTYATGKTAAMDDVNFANDTSQTVPLKWVATTPAIDSLPDLQSMGTMSSLHQAMAKDTSGALQAMVTLFTTETTIASRNATMEQILIDWAGGQNVNPNSRNTNGGVINAQHLAVLEAAMGRGYTEGASHDPGSASVPLLNDDYFLLFERSYAELAAQTFLKPFYSEIATITDSNGTHFDFTKVLADLFGTSRSASVQQTDVLEFYRTVFASGLLDSQVNYAGLLSSLASGAPQYVSAVNALVAPYYAYDLEAGITTYFDLKASADGSTIVGGLGGNTIDANTGPSGSSYNTTVYGNAGTNIINAGPYGVDQIYGGTGNDTIYDSGILAAGTVIDGGAGNNMLILSGSPDITQATISRIQTLNLNGSTVKMTAAQLGGFNKLDAGVINATSAGTYNLAGKTVTGLFNLGAQNTSANVTLIGNNQAAQILYGGTGADILTAGSGAGDILYAGSGATTLNAGSGGDSLWDGSGIDVLNGGVGNDTFTIGSATVGSSVTGGGGSDTLVANAYDISGISIGGVQTLQVTNGYVKLTVSQFGGFGSMVSPSGTKVLYAMTAGTYNLAGKTVTGLFNLGAQNTSANVTLIGNNQAAQILYGGTGADILTAGSGAGDILYGGSGNTTMNAGTGNDILYGGSGYNTYKFGTVFGQDVVNNGGGTIAKGEIDFASGITDEKLWFKQSGNDLLIDLMGTSDQIDVSGWFGSNAGAKVQTINAGGLKLDTQVLQLVNAMAAYGIANPSFNPVTATAMPTNTTLQTAIAAAWHS